MSRLAWSGIFLGAVFCLLAAGALWWLQQETKPLHIDQQQTVLIQSGDHLDRVGRRLQQEGWLPWSLLQFEVYSRLTAHRGHIKSGEYRLEPGMTVPQLLDRLRSGAVIQRSITFPEGWTVDQWLLALAANSVLIDNDLESMKQTLGPLNQYEGRWYPDTYAFTRGDSALDVIARAERAMTRVVAETWSLRSSRTVVETPEQMLILASMIEKETGYESDRRLIASVFSNRIQAGMKLQSDPTVIYGLEAFDGDLKRRHLSVRHPYNTYVIDSLPLGPICNPGRASLEAAVNPEISDYFYFVAKGDGRSHFSETLKQHNQAVVQYQKSGRVENYRSAPPVQ